MIKKDKRKNPLNEAPKLNSTDPVILELWARAGGWCEFHGCNTYLPQDKLTTNEAKLVDIGYIVARSKDEPRGNDPLPLKERNHINNLMLLFTNHHRLIDRIKLEERLLEYLTKKEIKSHWLCYCGSGKKLRGCHIDKLKELISKISCNDAIKSFNVMSKDYKAYLCV